jgi:plastocyanin
MRSLFLGIGLGVASLGLLGLAPSEAQAWGPRFYASYSYPVMRVYSYPAMIYSPSVRPAYYPYYPAVMRYSYAAPVMPCPPGYYPSASYAPSYGPSSYGAAPSYGPAQPGAAVTVGVYDNYFGPPPITVPPGTTVRWTNYGHHHHTVTSRTGAFDSGEFGSGGSYSYTFQAPGTYEYYCRIHAEMRGTVVVR